MKTTNEDSIQSTVQTLDAPQDDKVILVTFDAAFYSDRALQARDQQEYAKAIKYCQRAITIEASNPIYHYNLASVLAESGYFEESNFALKHILQNLDPDMHECLYYMANNFAYLDEFVKAEESLIKYLSVDADGVFANEAREMLCHISEGLGKTAEDYPIELPETTPCIENHDLACSLLEIGEFEKAIKYLLPITKKNKDFFAAWNNLSLAYYYLKNIKAALSCAKHVLKRDPENIDALCNLALIYKHQQRNDDVAAIVNTIGKIIPLDINLTYKLANTLGLLGQDELAYRLLKGLLNHSEPPNIFIYHYLAIASINLGNINRAIDLWIKASKLETENDIINCFLCLVKEECDNLKQGHTKWRLNYNFLLPFEELLLCRDKQVLIDKLVNSLKENDYICASYVWAVKHGSDLAKDKAKQLARAIPAEQLAKILKPFTHNPNPASKTAKRIALLLLMIANRQAADQQEKNIVINITNKEDQNHKCPK